MSISRICCFPALSIMWYEPSILPLKIYAAANASQEKLNESIMLLNKSLQVSCFS